MDHVCEETGEGVVHIKDRRSEVVISFERLYYKAEAGSHTVTVETLVREKTCERDPA